jgi:hypothetical protein
MRITMKMKKKIIAFVIIAAALLAMPGAVFAAQDAAVVDNITVEYRYADGETPDIPASISQFGQTYNLVGTSGAVLESTLPSTRTYTYRVSGSVTADQLAQIQGAGDVSFSPVYVNKEEAADVPHTFSDLENNDVDELLAIAQATDVNLLLSGTLSEGRSFKVLELSDISYTVTQEEDGLPDEYQAECILRGVMITQVVGYYLANANFTTSVQEGDGINQYIVVAEYAPEALPPEELVVEEEVIEEPAEPEAELPTIGLSDADVALIAGQGNTPFDNVAKRLVPIGGFDVKGVWSFLSLLMSAIGIIIAIALALGALARHRRMKSYENLGVYDSEALALAKKRGNLLRVLTILFGLLTLLSFLILDDFYVGMVWINANTIIVGIFFIVTVVLLGCTTARHAKADRYAADELDSHIA